jgi:hypothetical protein
VADLRHGLIADHLRNPVFLQRFFDQNFVGFDSSCIEIILLPDNLRRPGRNGVSARRATDRQGGHYQFT